MSIANVPRIGKFEADDACGSSAGAELWQSSQVIKPGELLLDPDRESEFDSLVTLSV